MAKRRETIRLGIVPYLNVQPLIAHLSSPADGIDILPEVPSRLVPLLEEGSVDVGIVPVFSLITHPQWKIVPGVAIASKAAVQSVIVVSASPLEEIERIYLDPASRTSAALVQVLARVHWKRDIEFIKRSHLSLTQEAGTGYLVIGDQALRVQRHFSTVIDLGQEWRDWSGLSFIFAMWAVRPEVDIGPLATRLVEAREKIDDALLVQLAAEYHTELAMTQHETHAYLRDNLFFRIGEEEMQGLRLYIQQCQELGLAPAGPVPLDEVPVPISRTGLG